jgi:Icc-related predicted phosphoesterase
MRIAAVSDLHGFLVSTPPSELLLVGGDVCPLDDESVEYQRRWLEGTFTEWLLRRPAQAIVGIAGNHEFVAERDSELLRSLPWTYLQDEAATIDGLTIFGSPWSPTFGIWAFQAPDAALAQVWAQIPDHTNVVLVHGPPLGCGDRTIDGVNAGSATLRQRLEQLPQLKLTVFGHIHEGYGSGYLNGTSWLNASQVDENFDPVHEPHLIEIDYP